MNFQFMALTTQKPQTAKRCGVLKKFGVGPTTSRRAGLIAMASLGLMIWHSALAETYTVTDLGTLGGTDSRAFGINQKGMVVGVARSHHTDRAFVWKPAVPNGLTGGMSEIGASFFGNRIPTAAVAINDVPQVIADETDYQVFAPDYLWQDDNTPSLIVPPPDGAACWAVNTSGQVAGWTLAHSPLGWSVHRAMFWKPDTPNSTNGTLVVIPQLVTIYGFYDTEAYGINDYGQVVGYDDSNGGNRQGFLWTPSTPNGTNGTAVGIGDLGPNTVVDIPHAINNAGQIAGSVLVYDPLDNCYCDHAFLWTPTRPNGPSGTMRDLGVLSASSNLPNTSFAYALNGFGQVVGVSTTSTGEQHAFLWDSAHGMRDLNFLITTNSGWTLFEAWGINDSGQIAASGYFTKGQASYNRAVLLTPVLAPRLISSTVLSNGQYRFTLIGQPERSYTIQASSNLVNWIALTNFTSTTGTNEFTDAAAPSFSRRFYRAVTQ